MIVAWYALSSICAAGAVSLGVATESLWLVCVGVVSTVANISILWASS